MHSSIKGTFINDVTLEDVEGGQLYPKMAWRHLWTPLILLLFLYTYSCTSQTSLRWGSKFFSSYTASDLVPSNAKWYISKQVRTLITMLAAAGPSTSIENVPVLSAGRLPSVSSDQPRTAAVPRHPCEVPSLVPDSSVTSTTSLT